MTVTAKTFRVFVSSTFDDFVEERNLLQSEVFPELRERCEAKGFRFQPIDLRWGVPLDAGADQRVMEICLAEIDHCREISPRPNFIVLLGDRYGWRPLPRRLSEAEFALVTGRIPDAADAAYFAAWYPLDRNAVPNVDDPDEHEHELAPIGSPEREPWDEDRLRKIVDDALEGTPLEHDAKLVGSATEQEVEKGALSVPDASEHVFCFFRSIDGLAEEGLPRADAGSYVDRIPEWIDTDDARREHFAELGERLEDLKVRLADRLGEGNCYRYSETWGDVGPTRERLQDFADEIRERLWGVIEAEIEGRVFDELDVETNAHELFAEERASHFEGRVDVLEQIASYVAAPDGRPLGLWGEPGSGKSAVVAKAAQDAAAAHGGALLAERFVGATAASADGASLLRDLCREISTEYGDPTEVPSAYRDLVEALPKRLQLATAERPLLLFIDAVNQLSDADHARNLAWLPATLPDHVALVVSTATEPPESKRALAVKLPEDHLLQLEAMPVEEAGTVLDLWLADARRTLQPGQREEVLTKFREKGLPLYLKLAFEEARLWCWDAPHELHSGIQGVLLQDLFPRLEHPAAHGAMLVNRALSYIGAGKNGLTEDELLDVLAADEDFWDDFLERSRKEHELPEGERQLPVSVWSRLFFDLKPYLTERAADGTSLLGFYHLQLAEAVAARYLDGNEGVARHEALATYFAGRRERQGLEGNLRVLSELPYQQTKGGLWDQLFDTLTDFEFLERKATDVGVIATKDAEGTEIRTYTGVYALEEDFALALREMPGGDGQGADERHRIIVTATDLGKGLQIRCPHCNTFSDAREAWLGDDIPCPQEGCGGPLRVNTFIVPPDARFETRVAAEIERPPEPEPVELPLPREQASVPVTSPEPDLPPQAEMSPGASKVVETALVLYANHPCSGIGQNHWLAAALERYGPMAEGISPGLDAGGAARSARAGIEAGDGGPPLEMTDVVTRAADWALRRGKTTITERDLLTAILVGDPSPPPS